jgi:hypothetical protein
MTLKASNYPTTRPTLNLDFAKSKQLDPRITFSRSSTGTYVDANGVIQNAATDTARFDHNPATGESLGLLVEEARTNLYTYSEQFDNAAWTKSSASTTANNAVAPDGNTAADLLKEDSTNNTHFAYQTPSFTASTAYAVSVFAKPAGRTRLAVGGNSNLGGGLSTGIIFDLTGSGSVVVGGTGTANIQAYPNGWYRITYSWTSLSTGSFLLGFYLVSGTSTSYTGDNASGVNLWGAQLEAKAFPTSYIPTTIATVTRSADVAQMTGTNFSSWYNQNEGTVLASVRPYVIGNLSVWTISDGTIAERMLAYSGSVFNFYVDDNSSNQVNIGGYSFTANSLNTPAAAYKLNDFAYTRNGAAITTDTTGTLPTPNRLQIMAGYIGGEIQSGTIFRLAYWPTRLSDATLQTITQ